MNQSENDWSDVPSHFGTGSDIFVNKNLLKVGYVPDISDIVGRREQINAIGEVVGPGIMGDSPDTTLVYGKTGSGKSLVTQAVVRDAEYQAGLRGTDFHYAYVDCSEYRTETKASREIAREIKRSVEDDDFSIPRAGLAASDYRDMVWELMDKHNVDVFIVILDEIDILDSEDLIRSLSRAQESGKTEGYVSMIGISNKINYRERFDPRTDSSLRDHEFVFPPYDAHMIQEILCSREDAFHSDVLDEGVIPKIAALAARDHGDARKAVDMLYEAGVLAERHGLGRVTEDHVEQASDEAEINRVLKLVSNLPPHARYILQALALLTAQEDDDVKEDADSVDFRTSQVYDFYCVLCEKEGSNPLTQNRCRELLKEMAFLELTEYEAVSEGCGGFSARHRLLVNPDTVVEGLDRSLD